MPHQCTNCAREFDDGSKEMLSGCPDCGGNKFQFKPDGATADGDTTDDATADPAEPPEPPEPPGSSSVARTVGKTAATVRDLMGSSDSSEPSIGADETDPLGPDSEPITPARENTAQASARTDVVTPDELPSGTATETEHRFQPVRGETDDDGESDAQPADSDRTSRGGATTATHAESALEADASPSTDEATDADRPDLEELRSELNDQFESIKVCSPGQYELNLMELYDRDEYIIALQEDGRYSIQVPENFRE